MFPTAAIETGIASLLLRLAMASWVAMGLLSAIDRRKSVAAYQCLLCTLTTLLSIRGAVLSETVAASSGWWISSLCAMLWLYLNLRQWLTTSPLELHDEAHRQMEAENTATKKRRPASKKTATNRSVKYFPWDFSSLLITTIGGSAAGVSTTWQADFSGLLGASYGWAVVYLWTTTSLLGVSIVLSLEMSVLSAPDALSPSSGQRVAWSRLARITLVLVVAQSILCAVVFLTPVDTTAEELQLPLVARMFALTLIVVDAIAWAIPQRVARFQSGTHYTGRLYVPRLKTARLFNAGGDLPRASDWASLTLSSWIVFLAYMVLSALPANWPMGIGQLASSAAELQLLG